MLRKLFGSGIVGLVLLVSTMFSGTQALAFYQGTRWMCDSTGCGYTTCFYYTNGTLYYCYLVNPGGGWIGK